MKTTTKHFKYYSKRVRFWLNKLNMNHYSVALIHTFAEMDGYPVRGFCEHQKCARNAVIGLGKDWGGDPINHRELDQTALHEVLELLLADLIGMISERFMDASNIEPAKHSVIQTIVNTLIQERK